jgi:hypothetical protein
MLCIVYAKDLTMVGATISIQGKQATFHKAPWNASTEIARADITIPRQGSGALANAKLALPTPCGDKSVALKMDQTEADEKKAREGSGPLYIDVQKMEIPESVAVWMDVKGKVRIGTMDLASGRSTRLYEPACGNTTKTTVYIDGTEVGSFSADIIKRDKMLFITSKTGTCYTFEHVAYGTGFANKPEYLRGNSVYEISKGDTIEYFLTKAPDSKSVNTYTGSAYVTELVEAPCP